MGSRQPCAILENSSPFQRNGKPDSRLGEVRRLFGNVGIARARTGLTITANSAVPASAIIANAIQNGNKPIKSVDAIGMRITPSAAKVFTCGFAEPASSESMLIFIGVFFRRTNIPNGKSRYRTLSGKLEDKHGNACYQQQSCFRLVSG
jgi:hypothetical protein